LVELEDHSDEWFTAEQSGHGGLDGKAYERVVPDRFTSGGDDGFMRSMIMQYAQEGKNADGTPNGNFQMTEATTTQAAKEVLGTHLKLKGAELETYMKTYFPRTWKHFDVNSTGLVDAISMPQFMRFLASDQTLELS